MPTCPGSQCSGGDGSCNGFMHKWEKMQSVAPLGSGGNGIIPVCPPYGTMPMKYSPSGSSSVGRQMWDGWRYGQGYLGPNPGLVYGEPDWKYYRHNYCGPCGCACPGYNGDPNGQNPNIRYIQFDYNSLLGSGFAKQGVGHSETSQVILGLGQQPDSKLCPNYTSCGKKHCVQGSGVIKKAQKDVKFQVCIGEPCCPETMQPCPQSDVKVYVPTEMLPRCEKDEEPEPEAPPPPKDYCNVDTGAGGDDCEKKTDDECLEAKPKKKGQDYEIQIPGIPPPCPPQCPMLPRRTVWETVDPCGSCRACKNVGGGMTQKPAPFLVRSKLAQSPCGPCCKPKECVVDGQRYTTGPVLCNVKRPFRPNMRIRKGNYCA